jgi:hypothetical protein
MERLSAPAGPENDKVWRQLRWTIPVAIAALCALTGLALFRGIVGPKPTAGRVQAAIPAADAPPAPEPEPVIPKAAAPSKSVRVELTAVEPSWVAVYVDGKMTSGKVLEGGQTTAVDGEGKIRVRLGNAGGVEVTANGKPLGRLGSEGQARTLEFTAAGFRAVSNTSALPK